jgi:hypothetical protein
VLLSSCVVHKGGLPIPKHATVRGRCLGIGSSVTTYVVISRLQRSLTLADWELVRRPAFIYCLSTAISPLGGPVNGAAAGPTGAEIARAYVLRCIRTADGCVACLSLA